LLFYRGQNISFFAYEDAQGRCPAKDFFDGLTDDERRKVMMTIKHIDGHRGLVHNVEKFKKLEGQKGGGKDQFYEIKVFQIRIGCVFEPGGRLVLLYGFKKKGDAWPRGELQALHNTYNSLDAERR
jgi:hypothetical protein